MIYYYSSRGTNRGVRMDNEFMTASQAAKKWNISQRRVQVLCMNGRIGGVFKLGENWAIPANAKKPADGRKIIKDESNG